MDDELMKGAVSIVDSAVAAGFATYVPLPGLRGALFALFPGLAHRSASLMVKGALLGGILDIFYTAAWFALGLVWEPRAEFSRLLVYYLPPGHDVCTHCGCPVPNSVQFVFGLAGWATSFFLLWLCLWPRRLPAMAYVIVPGTGVLLVIIAAIVLWTLVPLNEWSYRFPSSREEIPPAVLVGAFISSIPLCTLNVGLLLRRFNSVVANKADRNTAA